MSRIWSMMDVGKRSMMNSQTALQTISHNVANKNTKGYSRQRVDLQANVPTTSQGGHRIGQGARAATIGRTNNAFLEKQIQQEGTRLGHDEARMESMGRVEQVFNEQLNKGLNKFSADFFNAYRELSSNPESLATRTLVKESADFLAKDFHRVTKQLHQVQDDIDFQLASRVAEVNEMTQEIADLNAKVQSIEIGGIKANDERDRRDQLLKDLGEIINIRYAEGKDGGVSVTAGNTAVLVSGHTASELEVRGTPPSEGKREGNLDIFYKSTKNSSAVNVTKQMTGGRIGGLLKVRDETINDLLAKTDDMAYSLARKVNEAHSYGYNQYGQRAPVLFDLDGAVEGAAARIRVSKAVQEDVGLIAAAAAPNSPADNRIANIIAELQNEKVMGGKDTFDSHYNSMVGETGVITSRANSRFESQADMVKQLKNIRESISGVSLDEETTKMIEFQKSFDASARLITTADEMMDTVLGLKR